MAYQHIGVIAGAMPDTQMGIDMLAARGMNGYPYPAASDARAQTEFQMLPENVRTDAVRKLMRKAMDEGTDAFLIYCNSLSSSVDMPALGKEFGVPVVTPLMAYGDYAKRYKTLAVIAGNNQALAGIERTILNAEEGRTVLGASLLPMVIAIEAGTPPEKIVEDLGLRSLLAYFRSCGAEALILGCTHFPYVRKALEAFTGMPILDPADRMAEILNCH